LFREKLPAIPSLAVEAGNFLSDERDYHRNLRPDAVVKSDWILQAYDQFPVDVINLSSYELRNVSRVLSGDSTSGKGRKVAESMLSANIQAGSTASKAPPAFVIRELQIRGGRTIRIGFIGLTEMTPEPPPGYQIVDPADAARRSVEAVRSRADLVVALVRATKDEAIRIARQAGQIDLMIVAAANSLVDAVTMPVSVGKTALVFTSYETRSLGEVRFYPSEANRFTTRLRYIPLDDIVLDDAAALDFGNRARAAEDEARKTSKSQLEAFLEASRTFGRKVKPGSAFAGSNACAKCHEKQFIMDRTSPHAQATTKLVSRPAEFSADCISCHAWPAAFDGAPMQGISCEQCHGPGAEHAANPAKGYGKSGLAQACLACHTGQTSPRFDLRSAMVKVKH
jgi:hypothetical protein